MFEEPFIDRGPIARYCSTPRLEERLSHLEHCAHEGARPGTLRGIAAHQTRLVHLVGSGACRTPIPSMPSTLG